MAHESTTIGIDDLPYNPSKQGDDPLGIGKYLDGLATFIQRCPTPMTIAIQGDWGSGKTSAMNGVRQRLEDVGFKLIEFNTWQYSQFDLGDALVFSLVQEVVGPLQGDSDMAKRYLRRFVDFGRGVMRTASSLNSGIAVVNNVLDSAVDAFGDSDKRSIVEQVKALRTDFAQAVEDFCKRTGQQRVVVFVDDLDRLDPSRAVEVMENLKLFLECERVVFVLAIDFEVVSRGVQRKYGDGFTGAKARSFFDKIIQVPFRMPTNNYEIDGIMRTVFDTLDMQSLRDDQRKQYREAVRHSIGTNPRSLKRLLNTFALLKLILESGPDDRPDERLRLILFYLLCMQTAFPKFHERVSELASTTDNVDDLLLLPSEDADDGERTAIEQAEHKLEIPTDELQRRRRTFAVALRNVLEKNPDPLSLLKHGLSLSAVTTVGTGAAVETDDTSRSFGTSAIESIRAERGAGADQLDKLLTRVRELVGAEFSFALTPSSTDEVVLYNNTEDHVRGSSWGTRVGWVRVNKSGTMAVGFGPSAAEGRPNYWGSDEGWRALAEDLLAVWGKQAPGREGTMVFSDPKRGEHARNHPFGFVKVRSDREIEAVAQALAEAHRLSRR